MRCVWLRAAWPLFVAVFFTTHAALRHQGISEASARNAAYGLVALAVLVAERVDPFRPEWNRRSSSIRTDLLHTLATYIAQHYTGALVGAVCARLGVRARSSGDWSGVLAARTESLCAVLCVEFFTYWQHRLSHTVECGWRFHAVHHSPVHMNALNTGRFHALNAATAHALRVLPIALLGFSPRSIADVGALVAVVGLLSHCNVCMSTSGALR